MATEACEHRINLLLSKANLVPPQRIPRITKPEAVDFQALVPESYQDARLMLIQQRTSEPGYKPPDQQLRNKWSSRRKEEKANQENWTFSKHEVAKAFNSLVSRRPLATPGVAQALITIGAVDSLEELWCHLHDAKLEKRSTSKLEQQVTSRFRRSRSSICPETSWLDEVTEQGDLNYIRLMCAAGLDQETVNRAFSVALSKQSLSTMEMLLGYGSIASSCRNDISEQLKQQQHGLALARLLLSSPNAMSIEAWRYCMEPQLQGSTAILLLCFAHRPEVVCGDLLLKSLQAQNFEATAITLAYASDNDDFRSNHESTCKLASAVPDSIMRFKFFEILSEFGFLKDCGILQEELMKDVKLRQLSLIQILADAGVYLDIEPNNAFHHAVSTMDCEVLDIIKNGKFFSPVSPALKIVPDETSEADMLRLLSILATHNLAGEPLHSHLVRAVKRQHIQLMEALMDRGASVEFERCTAIRVAVQASNLDALNVLLRGKCSSENLSTIIPTAIALTSRSDRMRAMRSLLKKGVVTADLGFPLETLVAEEGVDVELVQLLIQHHAPVDGTGNTAGNAVLTATRRGNASVLRMLCEAGPREETMSKAVPLAFEKIEEYGYDVAQDMTKTLLQQGATGLPVNQALVTAVTQGLRLDMVRLLVKHGADANFEAGASFTVALEKHNIEALEILCSGCPPKRASIESALLTAIHPRHFTLPALELLLSSCHDSGDALNASWNSEKFKSNPNMTTILSCFLQHGLDVDLGKGVLLCFAIEEDDVILLGKILSFKPSKRTLSTAFLATGDVKARHMRLCMMEMLLKQAESAEIGQSKMLLQETKLALAGDVGGLQLLLRHNAAVDYDDGVALQAAASAGSGGVLDTLFSGKPASSTLSKACLAAASSSLDNDEKSYVFKHIFAANDGVLESEMSKLLADSIASQPESTQLPSLLLERGADIKLETMQLAAMKSSREVFLLLTSYIRSPNTVVKIFRYVRKAAMSLMRKYWIYECLLSKGIDGDEVSEALLDFLELGELSDLDVPKLLLGSGASVAHNNCKAFQLALRARSLDSIILLSQFIPDDITANLAFDIARKTSLDSSFVRLEVYRCLLQWTISISSIHNALVECLAEDQSDQPIVRLLVAKGANPNKDGAQCFILAAQKDREPEFRALCKHANLSILLLALLSSFHEEWQVAWWFGVCLEEQPHNADLDLKQEELLFACLEAFPSGIKLLKLLLANGLPASAVRLQTLCPDWQPELCTALIWALFSQRRIGNDTILMLLAHDAARFRDDPTYLSFATSSTGVSAAFGCLLDVKRAPILKHILDLDRDGTLAYEISGASLTHLASYPNVVKSESGLIGPGEMITLRYASLYLGNLEAFRLVNKGEKVDDGMLHLATLLALPRFVQWLLETHDPNLKREEFDQMVPLALACKAKAQPWSKIANAESDFRTRQKEIMHLLAPRTSVKWRYLGKTVLHIAMENGVETTRAMMDALDTRLDSGRYETYLYTDKEGNGYYPHAYLSSIMDRTPAEKAALATCLEHGGFDPSFSLPADDDSEDVALLPPTYTSST